MASPSQINSTCSGFESTTRHGTGVVAGSCTAAGNMFAVGWDGKSMTIKTPVGTIASGN